MQKVYLPLAIGAVFITAYAIYRKKGKNKKPFRPPLSSDRFFNKSQSQDNNNLEDRVLYSQQITDPYKYQLILQKPKLDPTIQHLSYHIILNINKGMNYQGVVTIKAKSQKGQGNKKNLIINFAGQQILYIGVNGLRLNPENQFKYEKHVIQINKQFLNENQNEIQIIFSNKYAFLGHGLAIYFPLDEQTNKYSLKRQVVYSHNGVYQAPRIIPCLNNLNQCQVFVQMLHADGFDAFSNAPKSLYRSVSKNNYPYYSFMFQASEKKLNRSFKINTSGYSDNNSSFLSFDDIIKENSQFYEHKLDSIHDLFLFCGKIVEAHPSIEDAPSSSLLLRYFVREHLSKKATTLLNTLQCQINDIYQRIQNYRKKSDTSVSVNLSSSINSEFMHKKSFSKVDIFFIDDIHCQGDFYKGSILLSENTIQRGVIDRRIYYLLCRALLGMSIPHHQLILGLLGKVQLNELVVQIFPECADFIFLKQIQYRSIKDNCLKYIQSKQSQEQEYWIQQFYQKHCKYFVRNQNFDESAVNKDVIKLISQINTYESQEYWAKFIAIYPFLQFSSSQILIKISIQHKGIPQNQQYLNYAKQQFKKSKYYLQFISNQQIQNNLPKYIQSYGIEYKLPQIRIKTKFSDCITLRNQKYLSMKANRLEVRNLYEQFKRFNEERSFHHITILKEQIERIRILIGKQITEECRKNLQCGLIGWKLLSKLKIYPEDQEMYKLIKRLLGINKQ